MPNFFFFFLHYHGTNLNLEWGKSSNANGARSKLADSVAPENFASVASENYKKTSETSDTFDLFHVSDFH